MSSHKLCMKSKNTALNQLHFRPKRNFTWPRGKGLTSINQSDFSGLKLKLNQQLLWLLSECGNCTRPPPETTQQHTRFVCYPQGYGSVKFLPDFILHTPCQNWGWVGKLR
ncbi:hypothetical protein CDAR_538241 [Caerostris darwini]|uniref:Uncharacterized protein n=1 Tax=Caerostris darwini TaxID=1538125 RepID=A0AAV4UCE6_9ARAC|nr:hypothetical protein CDAR_538241 [Caerostris darwini]